jgi:hypothetical protein
LWCAPFVSERRAAGLRWQQVADAGELAEWEHAWAGGGAPSAERIFVPRLLHRPDTAFIAFERDARFIAGVALHRAADLVGLTNLFVPSDDPERYRRACVHAAASLFPGLPLVTYEVDADVPACERLGFEAIGPLRVWVRGDANPPQSTLPHSQA